MARRAQLPDAFLEHGKVRAVGDSRSPWLKTVCCDSSTSQPLDGGLRSEKSHRTRRRQVSLVPVGVRRRSDCRQRGAFSLKGVLAGVAFGSLGRPVLLFPDPVSGSCGRGRFRTSCQTLYRMHGQAGRMELFRSNETGLAASNPACTANRWRRLLPPSWTSEPTYFARCLLRPP